MGNTLGAREKVCYLKTSLLQVFRGLFLSGIKMSEATADAEVLISKTVEKDKNFRLKGD